MPVYRIAFLLMSTAFPALAAGACSAVSGPATAALVELYTSEGCSSCPPADRWLSTLGVRGLAPGRVVPLSLHVDYWDYIGWKDPYAKPAFAGRQRKLTQAQRLAFVYTPQVMLQGRDFRGWSTAAFDTEVARINRQPARARIELAYEPGGGPAWTVQASAELARPGTAPHAALYVASYENRLASRVTAGENRGSTLEHDYVVLEWLGPFELGAAGARTERLRVPLLPRAVPEHSGVVAFVQDRRSLEVLQALMLPACAPVKQGKD